MNDSFSDSARGKYKSLQAADFPKKLSERLPQYKGVGKVHWLNKYKDLAAFEWVEREVQRHLEIWECSREKISRIDNLICFFSCSFKRLAVNFNCGKAWDTGKRVAVVRELQAIKEK